VAVPDTDLRTCTAARASVEVLAELIAHNLGTLDRMIDYNIQNDIRMLRISSDIIPFGSSPVNTLYWPKKFAKSLKELGEKALAAGIRLSMHPGQYTVLNSPDKEVVKRAILDLEYHCTFLDALGLPAESKMILHVGGVYGDKELAMQRFAENYEKLPGAVKRRLVIENDERSYNIVDVLYLGRNLNIPVVFDNLHHALNVPLIQRSESEWLSLCRETWTTEDGDQKIHYSQQAEGKRRGAHSDTIKAAVFADFVKQMPSEQTDIMLEVKDKNRSAVKCINYLGQHRDMEDLEIEWTRYKYDVLSQSPDIYHEIDRLLKEQEPYPAKQFYDLIDQAAKAPPNREHQLNTADSIWEYLRSIVAARDEKLYRQKAEAFKRGEIEETALRQMIYRVVCRYRQTELLKSYYFAV